MINIPEPTDLRDYLKAQGWTLLTEGIRDRLFVMESKKYPNRQMIFPIDLNAIDYVESVGTVIEKVSELTKQSAAQLTTKINAVRDDLFKIRLFFDGDDSFLPLSFATAAVQNTERVLRAAACTVVRPRPRHPKLTLTEAGQLVDKSRFLQTAEGSFIIQVSCPVNAMDAQGTLPFTDGEAPFVRQVTASLDSALDQLRTAIEEDTLDALVSHLKTSPAPIISSNLCEALVGIHDPDLNNSVDFSFEWSGLRPRPSASRYGPIRFQRDYFERIDEVARELRTVEEEEPDTFLGTVERLDGDMGPDGRRSGSVVVALLLPDEGEIVRARVSLDVEQYATADRAHMTNGAYVRVTGRLLPGRQPRQLADMSRFDVLNRTASDVV